MRSAVLIVPGSIESRTGGYIYDRRIVDGLRRIGWTVEVRELEGSFPDPTTDARARAAAVFAAVPADTPVIVDGLALSALPEIAEAHADRLRLVALVHLALGAEVGLAAATIAHRKQAERRALHAVRAVVATGSATARFLDSYDIPRDRLVLIEPGTDPAPVARGSRSDVLSLLCVATLHRGKGHDILMEALAEVPGAGWRLTCAGNLDRDAAFVERIRATVKRLGLEDRVSFAGELDTDALAARYDEADVFVLATLQETYGMAVAEALARGLPVVSTMTGAIPDLVGDDAGIIVPSGNVGALADALTRVIDDAGLRAQLAEGARSVRDRLPRWDTAVEKMRATLIALDQHG